MQNKNEQNQSNKEHNVGIELHNLKTKGRNRKRRKARGIAAGQGRTAGRGNSGQKSRAGYAKKRGFEGGQNPLYRRVSKRGFKNINRVEYSVINVGKLNIFSDNQIITKSELLDKGIIPKKKRPIKILGGGVLEKKLIVKVDKFSKEAKRKIEATAGQAIVSS